MSKHLTDFILPPLPLSDADEHDPALRPLTTVTGNYFCLNRPERQSPNRSPPPMQTTFPGGVAETARFLRGQIILILPLYNIPRLIARARVRLRGDH
jgi:hypothetical protein